VTGLEPDTAYSFTLREACISPLSEASVEYVHTELFRTLPGEWVAWQ
jgi:hypothetical protein